MRIALAQMDIIWEDKSANKQKCEYLIRKAKEKEVDLLVFPEMTLTGFSMNIENIAEEIEDANHRSADENSNGNHNGNEAETNIPNKEETIEWFKAKAKEFGLHIAFGFVEKAQDNCGNSKGKNNLSIVSSDGDEILRYTKIHPFSFGGENEFYIAGNDVTLTRIKDFYISTFICYDLRFPEVFQMASDKAEIIIVIANWPRVRRKHWTALLKARAIENQCYIAGVNRIGVGDNIEYAGDSMIIGPDGSILAEAGLEARDQIIFADLDKKSVSFLRESFPVKKDRRDKATIFRA